MCLRRHLDSLPPETPIWDVVDCYRVWESHADTGARRIVQPGQERTLPVYTMDEPGFGLDDRMVSAVTISPVVPDHLETLLRWLLPAVLAGGVTVGVTSPAVAGAASPADAC